MNETLADLPAIYGFETDTDVFPNIHSMDNAVRGKVLTSVYGGGTANTEYEFLTATAFISCLLAAVPMSSIWGVSSSPWPGS